MSHEALGVQFNEHVETFRKIRDEVRGAAEEHGFSPGDPMCGPVSQRVAEHLGGRHVGGEYRHDPEGHKRFFSQLKQGERRLPGMYRQPDGSYEQVSAPELKAVPHAWVEHSDHIIDTTHDQFGDEDIKIVPKSHPYARRYVPDN